MWITATLALTGGGLTLGGVALFLAQRRRETPSGASAAARPSTAPAGWIPVLSADDVLARSGALGRLPRIRERMGLTRAAWERDCLTVMQRLAEFLQLLPASEAHHHAHPGGLVDHTLECAEYALELRRGQLLPPGAAPEDMARHEHRWTYGVFLAALLHDIGKPLSDLRVTTRNDRGDTLWTPLAGTLVEAGAAYYKVEFVEGRQYAAHSRLAVSLLQKLVPQPTLLWLSEDRALVQELTEYLGGEAQGSTLAGIVRQADGESVRRNLLTGPRTRFATARAVPLIERLMEALRRMLVEGARLPLNRSGAAGWVYEGDAWFVSKRLADAVRDYLKETESGAGLPGEDMNDRLFDTWQEYGALLPNPATGGAVWKVQVEGEQYRHVLTVLRFPLSKLYPDPSAYPSPIAGRVVVLSQDGQPLAEQPSGAVLAHDGASQSLVQENGALVQPVQTPAAAPTAAAPSGPARMQILAKPPKKPPEQPLVQTPDALVQPMEELPHDLGDPAPAGAATPEYLPQDDYLDDEDTAQDIETPAPVRAARVKPMELPVTPRTRSGATVPEAAQRFMAWVQEGLASGRLAYNESGAMVHFVAEGMFLASPRIFREFAQAYGETGDGTPSDKEGDRLGTGIQREVIRAGWHLKGKNKTNVLKYQVIRRNGRGGGLLTGIVIKEPARFVSPLPTPNPHLLPFKDGDDPGGQQEIA